MARQIKVRNGLVGEMLTSVVKQFFAVAKVDFNWQSWKGDLRKIL
jgi:hypothetical protein